MKTFFKIIGSNAVIIALSVVSPLLMAPFVNAADDEKSVTATVTVSNVSITVSDGSIDYETLEVNTLRDTTTTGTGLDDTQTVTNNGNVNIDIKVKGVDASPWTLGGTQGDEVYTHKTCVTNCDSSPSWTAMTTAYGDAILTNVAPAATPGIDFQIGTPTVTVSYTAKNVSVDIFGVEI
jgi:hypothetical protein